MSFSFLDNCWDNRSGRYFFQSTLINQGIEGVWSKVINDSEEDLIGVLDHICCTHVKGSISEKRTRLVKWKCSFQRKLFSFRGNMLKGWDYRTIAEGAACSYTLLSAPKLTSSLVIYSTLISDDPSQKRGLLISSSVQTGGMSSVPKGSQCHLISLVLKAIRTSNVELQTRTKKSFCISEKPFLMGRLIILNEIF